MSFRLKACQPALAFILLAEALLGYVPAEAVETRPLVEVRLLADRAQLRPGEKFRLGVLFKISPGSHIYWQNPGDAGLAPEIKWVLPEGFSAGPLFWPVPRRMEEPGGLFVNAYTGEVLLFSWVQPPPVLKESVARVAAQADWLVCRRICVQESARPEFELRAGPGLSGPGGDREVFEHFAGQVPRSAEDYPGLRAEAFWNGDEDGEGNTRIGVIRIETLDSEPALKAGPPEIQWFGYPSPSLSSENIHLDPEQSRGNRLVFYLLVRKLEDNQPWPRLWGGVLTVRLSESNPKAVDYSLSFNFSDRAFSP